jgi:hypothetical protein
MKSLLKYTAYTILLSTAVFAASHDRISITTEEAELISYRIWQNEAAGKLEYLIFWNKNEPFLSLGLAHFLWYGKTNKNHYQEMFPKLLAYFSEHNVRLPGWLHPDTPCPWESRAEFLEAKKSDSPKYHDLYKLLIRTMPIQVDFIVERMQRSLPKILATLDSEKEKKRVEEAYNSVLHNADGTISPLGLYAVIDYVNFKGEGTSPEERYKGEGWGLLQVLLEMEPKTDNPQQAFADAAKRVMNRRIENAPPDRNESRWKKGWFLRIDSYADH